MLEPVQDLDALAQRLHRIAQKVKERDVTDYVISQVRNSHAAAFKFSGIDLWMVVERIVAGDTFLNVWCLEGSGMSLKHVPEVVNLIDELARLVGADYWKMESPRKGWARVLKGYADPVRTVYERKVPNAYQ